MKKCNFCNIEKTLDEFPKSRSNRSCCKLCFNLKQKEWRLKNPEKFKASQNKYRKKKSKEIYRTK